MNLDNLLNKFPPDVRESTTMQGIVVLIQTLFEQLDKSQKQLQTTQEQLSKAHEKIVVLEKEISKLRKTPKRPKFRPNGMEPRDRGNKHPSGSPPLPPNFPLAQREISEVVIRASNVPPRARFKGYQTFTVQEISIIAKEITYKMEVWQTDRGDIIRATLPEELKGKHFGPTLSALSSNLYALGMTQPTIHEFLQGVGVEISSGQINNILLNEAEGYSAVSEELLTAGLEEAPYIRTDDTGEKHQHQNGYCTHIGGQYFAYYKTTFSKSRENFLRILLQGKEGYYINEAMIWHLFQGGVKDDILNLFEECKGKTYCSKKGMSRFLNYLGLGCKKLREQCIEAGLVGFISETILKPGQVLLSDRAGQFALFDHAGCWIHMERPLRKIILTCEQAENELKMVRDSIWRLYHALKETALTQTGKDAVHKLYDDLVSLETISPEINAVINNFATYREEMLKALDHPGLPPHNNDSEQDIRGVAKRRNISGSTKSDLGRKFRDGLLSLKQTCFRLGYNFWDYLQRWHKGHPPNLADLVRNRYRMMAT